MNRILLALVMFSLLVRYASLEDPHPGFAKLEDYCLGQLSGHFQFARRPETAINLVVVNRLLCKDRFWHWTKPEDPIESRGEIKGMKKPRGEAILNSGGRKSLVGEKWVRKPGGEIDWGT